MSTDDNAFLALLRQFLPLLPLFLVWLAAGVYALVTWRRHPAVSLLTLAAVAVLIVTGIVGTLAFWYLLRNRAELMLSASTIGLLMSVLSIARSCLNTVAYVLLFVAVFGWRTSSARRLPEPPDE